MPTVISTVAWMSTVWSEKLQLLALLGSVGWSNGGEGQHASTLPNDDDEEQANSATTCSEEGARPETTPNVRADGAFEQDAFR